MIDAYLGALAGELDAAGVRGGDARRVLDEARDHLLEAAGRTDEPTAVRSFGSAGRLARQVAGELGTARTRSAALAAFASLRLAGAAYAVVFTTLPHAGSPDIAGGAVPGLGAAALAGVVFFPQLAFVAGCLALIRVLRLKSSGAQPGEELRVQRARVTVALVAGALTFASFVVMTVDYGGHLAGWWRALALAVSVPLVLLLGGLLLPCRRAGRLQALPGEPAGDAATDLDAVFATVPMLRSAPRPRTAGQLLGVVATFAAAGVALAGAVAGDPLDGLLRAAFEATAVVLCFVALGRRLALR